MKHLFFGGIHPKYNKEMSIGVTECRVLEPHTVAIPMLQHIGVPCTPLVAVGDRVLKGQKIGDGEGLCIPVHASVSGTVIAVEPRPHVSGRDVLAVVIENDYRYDAVTVNPVSGQNEDAVLQAIREAGIVGMGGAAFPGSVKALSALGRVSTLIANACECEPYITADDFLLRTRAQRVLEGMQIIRDLLKPDRVVLAVEDNKKEAIANVKSMLDRYPGVELVVLPTRYPQGAEKQLIVAVTGQEVPSGQLPISVGCLVFNVSTYAAIYRAVKLGMPLTERYVTVSGETVGKPQNFRVPIGTSFHDIIEQAGGLTDATERVICGGPMMGVAQSNLAVPVVKATNAILCLPKDRNGAAQNPVCLRCAKCVGVCPMHLQPLYMYRYTNCENIKELNRLGVLDCIECGCCAYTCPGKLPLVETFRKGKAMVRKAKEEKK